MQGETRYYKVQALLPGLRREYRETDCRNAATCKLSLFIYRLLRVFDRFTASLQQQIIIADDNEHEEDVPPPPEGLPPPDGLSDDDDDDDDGDVSQGTTRLNLTRQPSIACMHRGFVCLAD